MLWLVLGLIALVLFAVWVTWTAMRIDRLNARCEGAWQSLDAQLLRRALALQNVSVDAADAVATQQVTATALSADRQRRAAAENALSAAIAALPPGRADETLRHACLQVRTARTFYNDAVRAYRALRGQRLPRMLRLGARTEVPPYFDIDDSPGGARPGTD